MQYALQFLNLPAKPRFAGLLPSTVAAVAVWRLRSRTRRHLAALDARGLADIGLASAHQGAEAGKWFWQS